MSLGTQTFAAEETKIITTYKIPEILEALSKIQDNAIIFIDVDDTLITPKSDIFRMSSPYRFLIDDLKRDRDNYPNFETILSHWRLQRKIMLVDNAWPSIIEDLKKKYPVYALTKMESGPIGEIFSMEKWRFDELAKLGIIFTPSFNGVSEATLVKGSMPATFYKGIFITGSFSKGEILKAFFDMEKPGQIIFIDDREAYLQDAIEVCQRHSIPFLGILYRGVDLIPGKINPKGADFQKQQLLNHTKWFEDEDAEKQISVIGV